MFYDTLRQAGRGRIWLVLLLYSLLGWLVLYAHYAFLSVPFYSLIHWWTRQISESNAILFSHYPGHFLLLPHYFGWAKQLSVGLLFEGLMLGAVAVQFRNAFLDATGEDRLPARSVFRLWIHLLLAWVAINALTVLVSLYMPEWFEFLHQNSPRRLLAFQFLVMPVFFAIILAVFYFSIASIAIYRENVFRGMYRSVRLFLRRPITTFCLAACVLALPYLLSVIANRSDDIIVKFHPELVYWILIAGLVAEVVANFFWMGTAVRFLLDEAAEE